MMPVFVHWPPYFPATLYYLEIVARLMEPVSAGYRLDAAATGEIVYDEILYHGDRIHKRG